jgi:hypothetical protein
MDTEQIARLADVLGVPRSTFNFQRNYGLNPQETKSVAYTIAGSLCVIAVAAVGLALAGLSIASAISSRDDREDWLA